MRKTAFALVILLGLLTAAPAMPVLGLSSTACRVKNLDTGVTKKNLQAAVKAAKAGHHLTVRGICHGTTRIGKNLSITGIRPSGAVSPKLDGDKQGSVVTIARGRTAVISQLIITGGTGTIEEIECAGTDQSCGGGIWNHGVLTLVSVRVVGNTATYGGGVHNMDDVLQPTLKLMGTTAISGNKAIGSNAFGGGVDNDATLLMYGSSRISGNTADTFAGGVYSEGPIRLYGSSRISGNTAKHGDGGGVYNNFGNLKLFAASRISGNSAPDGRGGGVYLQADTVTLSGLSQISGNSAPDGQGGGIFVDLNGVFDLGQCGPGKPVHDNLGGDCAP